MPTPPPLPEEFPESFTVTVHGTCFGGREQLLEGLARGDELALVPDPPVQEEPEVWVHLVSGRPVGHLPPEVSAWLAPWLQRGGVARARTLRVHGPDAPSWRRLVIEVVCGQDSAPSIRERLA